MKRISLIALFCALLASLSGTVWHVNNNTSMSADFTQISTAVADANVVNGDTLYVYGSTSYYSNTTLSKRLTVIGTGYFLGDNPGLQTSTVGTGTLNFTLSTGSEGSVLAGLHVTETLTLQTPNNSVIGCRIYKLAVTASNNIIQGCFFSRMPGYDLVTAYLSNASNTVISNCFFGGSNCGSALRIYSNSSAIVTDCVIMGNCNLYNTEMYNNIFYPDETYGLSWAATSCNVHHNVFAYDDGIDWTTIISDTTNVLNCTDNLFVGGNSSDGKYVLDDTGTNAALTAGILDDECGMFGGVTPYKLSGIPAIPTIYEFYVPSSGNTLPIRVKARTND